MQRIPRRVSCTLQCLTQLLRTTENDQGPPRGALDRGRSAVIGNPRGSGPGTEIVPDSRRSHARRACAIPSLAYPPPPSPSLPSSCSPSRPFGTRGFLFCVPPLRPANRLPFPRALSFSLFREVPPLRCFSLLHSSLELRVSSSFSLCLFPQPLATATRTQLVSSPPLWMRVCARACARAPACCVYFNAFHSV